MRDFLLFTIAIYLFILLTQAAPPLPPPPPYKTRFYDQTLDHFNFATEPQTYRQRYLISDEYWTGNYPGNCKGPIFFYTGNESPVTTYYENSGFFTQVLAPQHKALLVFAEHRYFGDSLPFGRESFEYGKINYLSPEQAMADYVQLVSHLKETLDGAENCPVFAFGGSYGGMLTTWIRMKYPNIFMAGFASSAPLSFLGTGISPYAFSETATSTFEDALPTCSGLIHDAFVALENLSLTEEGRKQFSQDLKLCGPLQNVDEAIATIGWMVSGLQGMAMLDYPYETDYGIILPAWPVNKTCEIIVSQTPIIGLVPAFAQAIGVFYNNTDLSCYNITTDVPNWGKCCGWDYLACTEVYLPSGSNGMFPFVPYSLEGDTKSCFHQFNVTLRPYWGKMEFGGFNLSAGSYILFSNGMLDPWHTSGMLTSLKDTMPAILIPESAHHFDFRAPNEADPIYVTQARQYEAGVINQWLTEYFDTLKSQH